MCYQYWPSSGNQQYGEYSVDLLGEEVLEGRVLRTLNITHSKVELLTSKIGLQKWQSTQIIYIHLNVNDLPIYHS